MRNSISIEAATFCSLILKFTLLSNRAVIQQWWTILRHTSIWLEPLLLWCWLLK